MKHADHVALLKDGVPAPGGLWADFGSGGGAFTLALAELIGPGGEIYSIDHSGEALREQQAAMRLRFAQTKLHTIQQDFNAPLALPALDGIVMANALHFQRDKERTLLQVRNCLKPGGPFILVEYNADKGNLWVPYPLSITTWLDLARRSGFLATRQLAKVPSSFLGEIYSAISLAA
jgi:SAM-dependent methyltransferase